MTGKKSRRTDAEVMEALRADTPLNRARAKFSGFCGRIEQEGMQRRPVGPIEIRRLEFEAVEAIAAALSIDGETALDRLQALEAAGQLVLAGLNARIDAAPSTDKPVFMGIADLHDELNLTRFWLSSHSPNPTEAKEG